MKHGTDFAPMTTMSFVRAVLPMLLALGAASGAPGEECSPDDAVPERVRRRVEMIVSLAAATPAHEPFCATPVQPHAAPEPSGRH